MLRPLEKKEKKLRYPVLGHPFLNPKLVLSCSKNMKVRLV